MNEKRNRRPKEARAAAAHPGPGRDRVRYPAHRRRPWWRGVSVLAAALTVLALSPPAVLAALIRGEVRQITQPDGSPVELRVWGDEFYTVAEALDGYTVVRDPKTRFVCYARLAPDGDRLVSTGVPAGTADPARLGLVPKLRIDPAAARALVRASRQDAETRLGYGPYGLRDRSRATSTGDVVGICLLVDFSDCVGTITPASVENYCNQIGYSGGGNNGSVHDYFADVSGGLLNYTNWVPTAYFRASQPKTYYMDPGVAWGTRARELAIEALNALNAAGFDFSEYDADDSGRIDAINLYYAGVSNTVWCEGLWPGSGGLDFCADGVCAERFQWSDMGSVLTLGTFCHENGHMLMHWPDLYDYDIPPDVESAGVGQFCIMCDGASATNPVQPCGYLKVYAGWTEPILLTTPAGGLGAPSAGNVVYKIAHPTLDNEFYMIENRQQTGRDTHLPDAGLAIWHIDTEGSNSNEQMTPALHYMVTLVQADGDWDLEHYVNWGDSTDLWGAPGFVSCTPFTSPNTSWWDGGVSGIFITDISAPASTMSFSFGGGVWVDFSYSGVEQGTFSQPYNTLAEGVGAVAVGGTIVIKTGSTAAATTITKALTLTTFGGPVTIGE